MQKVLTAEQMREVDRLTTEKYGIPSILLMENAAHAVARVITEKLGGSVWRKEVLVLCGKGNNGGDGAAIARLLHLSGADVEVVLLGKIADCQGDARANFEGAKGIRLAFNEFSEPEEWDEWFGGQSKNWDVVVDAILGTGIDRPVEGLIAHVISNIAPDNSASRFLGQRIVVSVDIPSGLISDAAETGDVHIESSITITLAAPKPANVLSPNASVGGELVVADIGVPLQLIKSVNSSLFLAEGWDADEWLVASEFSDASYKNKRGHALIIAGSESYSGAAVLSGNAAMRSGVGLVTIATPSSSKDSVASRVLPEVMVKGVAETASGSIDETAFEGLSVLLEKADSVAIGSGLSLNESTKKFVQRVVKNRRQVTIVDADALTLLSPFAANGESSVPLILTPHEGEFMRLLGTDDKDAIKDRVAAVREFATKHNVILVLKGERVLIGEPGGKVVVNPTGNSGLGKAG
ncbi:MAG TPA: NAD(P)H-hydrate dehydratase, partial [Pyrinomonadaceae bacterium]|nr:NAD(P)H-hydrate dehydratase [Pyrinomonadaceae bacterium]